MRNRRENRPLHRHAKFPAVAYRTRTCFCHAVWSFFLQICSCGCSARSSANVIKRWVSSLYTAVTTTQHQQWHLVYQADVKQFHYNKAWPLLYNLRVNSSVVRQIESNNSYYNVLERYNIVQTKLAQRATDRSWNRNHMRRFNVCFRI